MVEQIGESVEQGLNNEVDALIGETDFDNFDVDGIDSNDTDLGKIGSALSESEWREKDYVSNSTIEYDGKSNINFDASEKGKVESLLTDYLLSLNIDSMFAGINLKADGVSRKLHSDLSDIQKDIADGKLELHLPKASNNTIKIGRNSKSDFASGTAFELRKPGSNKVAYLSLLFDQFVGSAYIEHDGRSKTFNNGAGGNLLKALTKNTEA